MNSKCIRSLLACMVITLLSSTAWAQGTGTIYGTIIDPSGLPVPNCKVKGVLLERTVIRTAITSAEGYYVLPSAPVGTYTISAEAAGFKSYTRTGVVLTTDQNVRVDVKLEIGSVTQSVEVSAAAPLVDTRSSTLGTLIDSRRITDLPLNGRNILQLAVLLPGTTQVNAAQMFTGYASGPTMSVSGSRTNENVFLFDGSLYHQLYRNTGLNYPPPDAMQEVKVLTNSFSAEYGRNAGSVFEAVTKSGTNKLHGSAWEFVRNNAFNARNFFQGSTIPKLVQNQFGGTLGGPILKNKLFVFGSYEGLRVRTTGLTASAYPATAAERAGDFSQAGQPVVDPLTGQPFLNNQIPIGRFDPVAVNLLGVMPLPTLSNGQYVAAYSNPQNNDQGLVRVDYNMGRHTIFGRFNYNRAAVSTIAGSIPSYMPVTQPLTSPNLSGADTIMIRPNLLLNFRAAWNSMKAGSQSGNDHHISEYGSNFPVLQGPKLSPEIDISGRLSLGYEGVDYADQTRTLQVSPNIQWIKGRHSIKTGFEFVRETYNSYSWADTGGAWSFTGYATGSPMADFVLGLPATLTVQNPAIFFNVHGSLYYSYFQDDWKISPRLSLNLGLRYELSPPWQPDSGWNETIRPGVQSIVFPNAPVGQLFFGDPGVTLAGYAYDKNNLAPRVGFAWDIFGNGRTVLRSAFGVFYEQYNMDAIWGMYNYPYQDNVLVDAPPSLVNPLANYGSIPTTIKLDKNLAFPAGIGVAFTDPTLRSPYIYDVNVNVQREVTKDLMIQVGYVSKLSHKLPGGIDTNPAIYAPGATLANIDSRRLLPQFGENWMYTGQLNANYHSLQVQGTKRFSSGFSLQGAYAFSKSLDLGSNIANGPVVPQPLNIHTQYGLSDFYAKHVASLSGIWDIPTLKSNAVTRAILGGWQADGLVTLYSGSPVNPLLGSDVALSGTPNQRPTVIGNPVLPSSRSLQAKLDAWFDRTVFVSPAAGTYGNAGRNSLIGPGSATANFAFVRNFKLPRESMRLQFRSEYFNLFNRVNLGGPSANFASGARMGRITSAGSPRVLQFALKLEL